MGVGRGLLLAAAGLAAAVPGAQAQVTPATGEVFVADGTGANVASDAAGGFVVGFDSTVDNDAKARRFAADGSPVTAAFDPSSDTNETTQSAVASAPDGRFVVAWSETVGADDDRVFFRLFDAAGLPLTPPTGAHDSTAPSHGNFHPDVAFNADGGFTIAWLKGGNPNGLLARRFDASGAPVTPVKTLHSGIILNDTVISIASTPFGLVAAWAEKSAQDADGGISYRRFNGALDPLDLEGQANSTIPGVPGEPEIAADANNGFVVAWHSPGQDGSELGVYSRRFNNIGTPASGEVLVSTTTAGSQADPGVASEPDGDYAVAWQEGVEPAANAPIFLRRFNASGIPVTDPVPVSEVAAYNAAPSVSVDAGGHLVVAWTRGVGSLASVHARRFAVAQVGGGLPARAGARLDLPSKLKVSRKGKVRLKLFCPPQQDAACHVWVGGASAKKVRLSPKKKKKRKLILGDLAGVSIPQGTPVIVEYTLSRKARRYLKRKAKLKARFTAMTNGVTETSTDVVTLRRAKPKRRRKS